MCFCILFLHFGVRPHALSLSTLKGRVANQAGQPHDHRASGWSSHFSLAHSRRAFAKMAHMGAGRKTGHPSKWLMPENASLDRVNLIVSRSHVAVAQNLTGGVMWVLVQFHLPGQAI